MEKGGTAEVHELLIESTTARNLYTYTGSIADLTDTANAFLDSNANITDTEPVLKTATAGLSGWRTRGKKDRVIGIGTAIPSAPVIAILESGARIFIGVEGGIVNMPAITTPDMYRYYWHQMF